MERPFVQLDEHKQVACNCRVTWTCVCVLGTKRAAVVRPGMISVVRALKLSIPEDDMISHHTVEHVYWLHKGCGYNSQVPCV